MQYHQSVDLGVFCRIILCCCIKWRKNVVVVVVATNTRTHTFTFASQFSSFHIHMHIHRIRRTPIFAPRSLLGPFHLRNCDHHMPSRHTHTSYINAAVSAAHKRIQSHSYAYAYARMHVCAREHRNTDTSTHTHTHRERERDRISTSL